MITMHKRIPDRRSNKVTRVYNYYKYKGLVDYISKSFKKIAIPIIILVVGFILIEKYVIDLDTAFEKFSNTFSAYSVFGSFLATESLLGLIPPELYIIWASKSETPWMFLTILALTSYIGGINSYIIGFGISKLKKTKQYIEVKIGKHINDLRRWGGILIIVGALFPIPFSIVCMAAGIVKFRLDHFFLYGLFRIARFYLYGIVIFHAV